MLSEQVLRTLAQIEELDRTQKATGADIPFWRVSGETGRLLHVLARATGAQRAIEVGTSSGYSGLFIASAVRAAGGHLWTLDMEPFKVALAGRHFQQAGLSDWITQVQGDALVTLPQLIASSDQPVDFALLDAVKPHYVRYLDAIRPRLRPGSVVCADNVGPRNAKVAADYLRAVRADPFVTSVVPTVNSEGEVDAIAVSVVGG